MKAKNTIAMTLLIVSLFLVGSCSGETRENTRSTIVDSKEKSQAVYSGTEFSAVSLSQLENAKIFGKRNTASLRLSGDSPSVSIENAVITFVKGVRLSESELRGVYDFPVEGSGSTILVSEFICHSECGIVSDDKDGGVKLTFTSSTGSLFVPEDSPSTLAYCKNCKVSSAAFDSEIARAEIPSTIRCGGDNYGECSNSLDSCVWNTRSSVYQCIKEATYSNCPGGCPAGEYCATDGINRGSCRKQATEPEEEIAEIPSTIRCGGDNYGECSNSLDSCVWNTRSSVYQCIKETTYANCLGGCPAGEYCSTDGINRGQCVPQAADPDPSPEPEEDPEEEPVERCILGTIWNVLLQQCVQEENPDPEEDPLPEESEQPEEEPGMCETTRTCENIDNSFWDETICNCRCEVGFPNVVQQPDGGYACEEEEMPDPETEPSPEPEPETEIEADTCDRALTQSSHPECGAYCITTHACVNYSDGNGWHLIDR